jgi:hypothetical protein
VWGGQGGSYVLLGERAISKRVLQMVKCWDLEQNKVIRHYHGVSPKSSRYAKDDDIAAINATNDAGVLNLVYEAKSVCVFARSSSCFLSRE